MKDENFANRIIRYIKSLDFNLPLPNGIRIMNPYRESDLIMGISQDFYNKYYSDSTGRRLILGINPGRFGAGVTGIPFTDPKHLVEDCNLSYDGIITHEPSSVFIYEMINFYGGTESFYRDYFIGAVCPLGFVVNKNGREVNFNYYDSKELLSIMYPFIIDNLKSLIALGIDTKVCYCLGTGKNCNFLFNLNNQFHFFEEIIPLEHPRFIIQYKLKSKEIYIEKYVRLLKQNHNGTHFTKVL